MVHPLLAGLGSVLFRNLIGWSKKSLEDGKIQSYEWKKLAVTTLQTGGLFIVAYYGLGYDEFVSAGAAILGDMLYSQIKRAVSKKKK